MQRRRCGRGESAWRWLDRVVRVRLGLAHIQRRAFLRAGWRKGGRLLSIIADGRNLFRHLQGNAYGIGGYRIVGYAILKFLKEHNVTGNALCRHDYLWAERNFSASQFLLSSRITYNIGKLKSTRLLCF